MITSNPQNNQISYNDGLLVTTNSCGYLYTGWTDMKEWVIQQDYQYSLKGIDLVKNRVWIVGGKSGYLYYCDMNTDKVYKS